MEEKQIKTSSFNFTVGMKSFKNTGFLHPELTEAMRPKRISENIDDINIFLFESPVLLRAWSPYGECSGATFEPCTVQSLDAALIKQCKEFRET